MTRTIGDYIVIILSILGSIASIFAYAEYVVPNLNDQGIMGILIIGAFAFIFLGYSLFLISKYRKKVRYADMFEELNIGFASIHSLDRKKKNDLDDIVSSLISICDALSNSFSSLHGNRIGVCIKHLEITNGKTIVKTLVRDQNSISNNRKTGEADKTKHWLSDNSDFKFIYANFDNDTIETESFFENHLPIKENYFNSRFKQWPPKKLPIGNRLNRRRQWPLKYKSTIVVPIVPLFANDGNQEALRGFLCIDSPKEATFNKEVDVKILRGVADGIYKKIDYINTLTNNNHGKSSRKSNSIQ